MWGACNAQACPPACVPQAETCNRQDDDCDRIADDGFDVGAACTVGIGACARNGNKVCKADNSGTECNVVAGPRGVETCNNVDDDCDGRTDQDVIRSCQNGCADIEFCNAGQWGACGTQPQVETCNNHDDDCDGNVDDGLTRECRTNCGVGVETCIAGSWYNCSVRQATNEVCNNFDDDCNGQADDNLFRACQNGCGGIETCNAGVWSSCSVQPQPEVCDNDDDNCNDISDDGAVCPADHACQGGQCVCTAVNYWSPTSMSASDANATPALGVTLTGQIRKSGDGLQFRVCGEGNFVNQIHAFVTDELAGGVVYEGDLNGIGQQCTEWLLLDTNHIDVDESYGGDITIVSPAHCDDEWHPNDSSGNCWNPPEPGCGYCWFMSTGVMTRTCRE